MIINDFFTNPERSARNVAENSQRVDSLVTDALRVMQGPQVSDAVLALKRVLGDREYNGRRGFYSFYVDQILDMYGQQNLAEGADDYLDSDPATGTDDETHELDTRPLTQDPDADYDDMMQPMEQEGNLPTGMRFQSAAGAAPPVDNVIDTDDPEQESGAAPVAPVQSTAKIADKDRSREDWVRLLRYDPFDPLRMAAAAGPAAAAANSVPARKPDGSRLINPNGLMAADDHEQYMKDLVAAEKQKKAAKQQANSVPASNAVSSNGKTEPVRMSVTVGPGGGAINNVRNPNIDDATVARAREWAAKQNAPASKTTAPAAASKTTAAPAWQDLARANKLDNPNRIYPGQKLTIPGRGQYEVQPGDTLSSIAARNTQAAAIPKYTPSPGNTLPAGAAMLKKYPNLGTDFPIPRNVLKDLGMDAQTKKEIAKYGREEVLTPAIIQQQKKAAANAAAYDDKLAAINNRKKTSVREDDIDNQTQVSSIQRDSTSDTGGQADQHYSSTSFQHDPNNPANNSYMDQQDHNGVASTTYARNVTPKWIDNLKANAGIPGAKPAAQPPSQYPTKVGQGTNNRPFAAYATPPGQLEINRESLDRMRSLAGIRKK